MTVDRTSTKFRPSATVAPAESRRLREEAANPVTPALPTPEREFRQRRLERISIRAHEIYEARGGEHGQALEDWLQAEREIDAETEPPLDEDDEE